MTAHVRDHVVILTGGVGGAKLAVGLSEVLPPASLTIIVNTGDDFEHLGLHVSPDLDTVMYSLAGIANPATGWGLAGDTFEAMQMIDRYGGASWFRIGDRDLGTNLMRTMLIAEGKTLTQATRHLCLSLGIERPLLPMSDDPVRTWVETESGPLAFQEYFVRERWQPAVREVRFVGAAEAPVTPEVASALEQASLILIGPSNPFLSIDPMLALPGIFQRIKESRARCVAVSPIIGGAAIKGPTAKLMSELGEEASPAGIARHYAEFVDALVFDRVDTSWAESVAELGVRPVLMQTLMETREQKVALATAIMDWVEENLA